MLSRESFNPLRILLRIEDLPRPHQLALATARAVQFRHATVVIAHGLVDGCRRVLDLAEIRQHEGFEQLNRFNAALQPLL